MKNGRLMEPSSQFLEICVNGDTVGAGAAEHKFQINPGPEIPIVGNPHRRELFDCSFVVPELFNEIPETATVGSPKRTIIEAVTAYILEGLCVVEAVKRNKVRDDSKTLLQTGIPHIDKIDSLSFTLEPNPWTSFTNHD